MFRRETLSWLFSPTVHRPCSWICRYSTFCMFESSHLVRVRARAGARVRVRARVGVRLKIGVRVRVGARVGVRVRVRVGVRRSART